MAGDNKKRVKYESVRIYDDKEVTAQENCCDAVTSR
jgi:hypothetical protein